MVGEGRNPRQHPENRNPAVGSERVACQATDSRLIPHRRPPLSPSLHRYPPQCPDLLNQKNQDCCFTFHLCPSPSPVLFPPPQCPFQLSVLLWGTTISASCRTAASATSIFYVHLCAHRWRLVVHCFALTNLFISLP